MPYLSDFKMALIYGTYNGFRATSLVLFCCIKKISLWGLKRIPVLPAGIETRGQGLLLFSFRSLL